MNTSTKPLDSSQLLMSISIMGGLYFILGFFTWINGPLISFVKVAFSLDDVNAFLVLMVFYLSYFFLALPSSFILKYTGMKKGLSLSLAIMALGVAIFAEFCTRRWYPGALGGLFIIGGSLALLQTSVNPYVSILGPIDSAAQRIALMGICNKLAGMAAPILFGIYVLKGMGDLSVQIENADAAGKEIILNTFAQRIHFPYLIMSGVLLVVSAIILKLPLPDINPSEANVDTSASKDNEEKTIFSFPHLWLGVLCLFVYVGAEVMAGDAIGIYGHSFNLPEDQTKFLTSFTLGAMLVGYIVGSVAIPKYISQEKYLSISAILGIIFSLGALFTSGYLSVGFVAALGFAHAMMWPAIFPLAIKGLGRFTETGSALLIMGIAGGAIIPQLFAVFKGHFNFQWVFGLLMIPCYLFILFYSIYGCKNHSEKS